jgi:hypothetical protein
MAQRGALRLAAGPTFGESTPKTSGIYLLSAGPFLGKHISISPSVGYIKFGEDETGFVPIGADITIHSFHSRRKVMPLFVLGAYFPLHDPEKEEWDMHGEFMGRLGIGAATFLSKNMKIGLTGNFMPFFYTQDQVYWPNETKLRNVFSVTVEFMFIKLK